MHSSRMRTTRSLPYGGGLRDRDPWAETPPGQRLPTVDRQTPLKTLPSQTWFTGGCDSGERQIISIIIPV